MPLHLFSYRWNGAEYCLEVEADNEAAARNRLYAMSHANYDGELMARVPSAPGVGLLLSAIAGIRNALIGGR